MMQNPCIFKGSLILEGVFILVNVQNFEFESEYTHKISLKKSKNYIFGFFFSKFAHLESAISSQLI